MREVCAQRRTVQQSHVWRKGVLPRRKHEACAGNMGYLQIASANKANAQERRICLKRTGSTEGHTSSAGFCSGICCNPLQLRVDSHAPSTVPTGSTLLDGCVWNACVFPFFTFHACSAAGCCTGALQEARRKEDEEEGQEDVLR